MCRQHAWCYLFYLSLKWEKTHSDKTVRINSNTQYNNNRRSSRSRPPHRKHAVLSVLISCAFCYEVIPFYTTICDDYN